MEIENQQKDKSKVSLQLWIIVIGLFLLIIKFGAFYITGSNAILTDALESIINVLAGSFALYSLILSDRPKDENHPYGHGKIEFISASFEGAMIGFAGLIIIGKSVYNLFNPQELGNLDIGILLTAGSGIVNYIIGFIAVRKAKSAHSIILEADGRHLKSDAYSSAGILIGLFVIYLTGLYWLDNMVAILFGIVILVTGYRILGKSVAGIMDEVDYKLLDKMVLELAEKRSPNCVDVHNLRAIKYGSTLHIDCHVTVPWYLSVKESDNELTHIENTLNRLFEGHAEAFIHPDPCQNSSCPHCLVENCPERVSPFEKPVVWTLKNLMINRKHSL